MTQLAQVVDLFSAGTQEGHLSEFELGQKALGLLQLPYRWQPPFFILPSALVFAFWDCVAHTEVEPERALGREVVETILVAIRRIAGEDEFIILRSSSADEDVNQRGAYESMVCRAEWPDIARCLKDISSLAFGENPGKQFAVIVQKLVSMKRASGHLSNERRVSRLKTTWLLEFDAIAGIGGAGIERFSSVNIEAANEKDALACQDPGVLGELLRSVASWATKVADRIHFEWLWDGAYLWLVQADRVPEVRGEAPAHAVQHLKRPQSVGQLKVLEREVELADEDWQKLKCVRVFRQSGLPTAELWVLRNRSVFEHLSESIVPSDLEADLKALLTYPLVIRTDLRRSSGEDFYMLPRTDAVSDFQAASDFLISTVISTVEQIGRSALDRVAFFLHHFIPSRSSAYSMAEPGSSRVRIDGIWGLPDGLLYYPHDSFELSIEPGAKIQKKVRFKDEYLDPALDGSWVARKAGIPWDWRSSLKDEDLRLIAAGTHRIANTLKSAVQVMWFVGIPSQVGGPTCLPWFYDTEEPPKSLHARRSSILREESFVVRRREDVRDLRRGAEAGEKVLWITVRPMPDLLRDRDFLSEVARTAKDLGASVELEGSVLSHAYYILRRAGVSVVVKDPFLAEEERKKFGKLVRDLIPAKIESHGERAVTVKLSSRALANFLRAKVVEEALELFWTDKADAALEELVDLRTVLDALLRQEGFSEELAAKVYEEKRRARGGFEEGLVLAETFEAPLIPTETEARTLFDEATMGGTFGEASAPRLSGPNLIIPLIPPNPERRHLSYGFHLSSLSVLINVRYREKDLIIEFSASPRRMEETGAQLSLF